MLYKEVDPGRNSRTHALIGVFFIALTFFTARATWQYIDQPRVLGTQIAQISIGGDGDGDGQQPGNLPGDPKGVPEPTTGVIQPTQAPAKATETPVRPTDVPVIIPTIAPQPTTFIPTAPTPTPQQQEITITDPNSEIIVKNEDNKLVIEDVKTDQPLVIIPAVPFEEGVEEELVSTIPGGTTTTTVPTNTSGTATNPTLPGSPVQVPTSGGSTRTTTSRDTTIVDRIFNFTSKTFSFGSRRSPDLLIDNPIPQSSVKITYASNIPVHNLDKWLKEYQYQVWALGANHVAIYLNGITTITMYDVKLGLSKTSFKIQTGQGEKLLLFSPHSVWSYLSDTYVISRDTHEKPIELVMRGNEMIYYITGHSRQMLLAIIPVQICKEIEVSAQTRDIYREETCSMLDSVMDFVSLRI